MASKRYRESYDMIDKTKRYDLDEAIGLLKGFPKTKFDETVEIHFACRKLQNI